MGEAYNALARRYGNRTIGRLKPGLLVVEGIVSHRLIERIRDWDVPHKAIIIRGTPDQFTAKYGGIIPPQLPRVLAELQQYHTMINVAEKVAEKWRAYPEIREMNYRTIPNCGMEEEGEAILRQDREALRSRLGIGPDEFLMVCVGSIQRRKGQDMLIDHLNSIHRLVPHFRLIFAGPVCAEAGGDIVLRRAEAHALRDRVRFLGSRMDVLQITRAADIFILPTREEAMPRAVLDAMIVQTPIVASAVDGIPELIESGKEGLLFDPSQPGFMLEAIRRMADDTSFRRECALQAYKKYRTAFSRARQHERYKAFVSEVLR